MDAKSSTVIVNTAAGLAVSQNSFAGLGSFAWQELNNEVSTKVENIKAETDRLNVVARNNTLGVNIAGNIAGTGSAAVGAALAHNSLKIKHHLL